MEKKEYLSPELKEMKFDVESLLQTVSGENAGCPDKCGEHSCDGECETDF
jgi:hypothetical protein